MPTTPRGITYPDSGGHTRLWEQLQALAETTDDALDALFASITPPPLQASRLVLPGAQSIPNSTTTVANLTTESYDNGDMHAAAATSLTVPEAGVYRISAGAAFASNGTGFRDFIVRKNGAAIGLTCRMNPISGQATIASGSGEFQLAALDVIDMTVFQSSGGALNLNAAETFLTVSRVR